MHDKITLYNDQDQDQWCPSHFDASAEKKVGLWCPGLDELQHSWDGGFYQAIPHGSLDYLTKTLQGLLDHGRIPLKIHPFSWARDVQQAWNQRWLWGCMVWIPKGASDGQSYLRAFQTVSKDELVGPDLPGPLLYWQGWCHQGICPLPMDGGLFQSVMAKWSQGSWVQWNKFLLCEDVLVLPDHRRVILRPKHRDFLHYLMQQSLVDPHKCIQQVWGLAEDTDTHTLESHVWTLRQVLDEHQSGLAILFDQGGYKLCHGSGAVG